MNTFIQTLKEQGRFKLALLLAAGNLFSIAMVAARFVYSGTLSYFFLVWNLFLAFLPLVISTYLWQRKKPLPGLIAVLCIAVWLLFFPNAPYITTDLFHLKTRPGAPLWYDTLLLLSFAWNGLLMGFISLWDIEHYVRRLWGNISANVFVFISIVLGSFGIYLGRFLRWNSWDILSDPLSLFIDIADRFIHPLQHSRTTGITIVFSVFLLLGYLVLKQLSNMKTEK